jgi:hypothetical protein
MVEVIKSHDRLASTPGTLAVPRVGSGKSCKTLKTLKLSILAMTPCIVPEYSFMFKGSGEMPAGTDDCSFVQVTVLEGGQRVGGRASTTSVSPLTSPDLSVRERVVLEVCSGRSV